MTPRAVLLVTMEPPAPLEEEFNDWYDLEHFPQRRSMPGFESASRWVCLDGWPRWLAIYDLASGGALQSEAYIAASGPRSTPWSRRMLPRTIGRARIVAHAIEHQEPLQLSSTRSARLVWAGFALEHADAALAIVADARQAWSAHPDLLQLRSFVSEEKPGTSTLWLFAVFGAPLRADALLTLLGRPGGQAPRTFNLYAPYYREA
jgi:hypothetical protein